MAEWREDLTPWLPELRRRQRCFERALDAIQSTEGSLRHFCVERGLRYYGLQPAAGGGGVWLREWAPHAIAASVIGDFNGWDESRHPCTKDEATGVFSVFLPAPCFAEGSKYKLAVQLRGGGGEWAHRVPAWARQTWQHPVSGDVCAVVPGDLEGYAWEHRRPPRPPSLRIYEAHVGMSSDAPRVASFLEFRTRVLPYVAALGYTALLLIAVHEHGYYASFGYQVSSYFAPAARCGPPRELQALVDAAHGLGLLVLMDLVHTHASSNTREGIGGMGAPDGEASQYFADGEAGRHAVWGTRLFDFGRVEVLRFLLANAYWFASAYRFDGFRFDAVSTALYTHRCTGGRGHFSGRYSEYFGAGCDVDDAAVVYFSLVNLLCHAGLDDLTDSTQRLPPLITLAEEHSGIPGLCAPLEEGGMGFDYRQAMAIPPLWTRLLSGNVGTLPMDEILRTLIDGRPEERRVAYCECHDQAIVGGLTLSHALMGPRLYDGMWTLMPPCPVVERGIALHKLSRLVTCTIAAHAYLTFMGNEFGHPEWVDFPREGNGHSYERARRQWGLAFSPTLRYQHLLNFERAMLALDHAHALLASRPPTRLECCSCQRRQLLCFIRARVLVVANFHAVLDAQVRRVAAGHRCGSLAKSPPALRRPPRHQMDVKKRVSCHPLLLKCCLTRMLENLVGVDSLGKHF
ncbi:hypothetical protein AB1Y20_022480 [Prymnesium parvum]|uniref:Glycosyl hydrolase family 13 catalytic domain-containing protein n=1 Tax=Prymnesium parvum TaxID=97485 RepID=A0AB34JG12_PRYPA